MNIWIRSAVNSGKLASSQTILRRWRLKPVRATDLCAVAAQYALNTAVPGLLIGAVQLLIGPPMDTRRLFRK
jgi:hypothetical protein